jgi:hypothetical protein
VLIRVLRFPLNAATRRASTFPISYNPYPNAVIPRHLQIADYIQLHSIPHSGFRTPCTSLSRNLRPSTTSPILARDTMPDMYAIQPCTKADTQSSKDASTPQYTPNIIPCKIHHDGAIESLDRYWAPVTDEKGATRSSIHSLSPSIKHREPIKI